MIGLLKAAVGPFKQKIGSPARWAVPPIFSGEAVSLRASHYAENRFPHARHGGGETSSPSLTRFVRPDGFLAGPNVGTISKNRRLL